MSNSISFSGRLGRDAETRYLADGKELTSFRVANTVGWGEREKTNWFSCTIWGSRGSKVAPYLTKGAQVVVHGEFSTREWDKDGQMMTSLEVNVRELDLVGSKGEAAPAKAAPAKAAPAKPAVDEDDIPF